MVRADAGAMPFGDGRVQHVVFNPPWGLQARRRGLWREVRRVLAPGGTAVALLHQPGPDRQHAVAAGLEIARELSISLFGAHPVAVGLRRT